MKEDSDFNKPVGLSLLKSDLFTFLGPERVCLVRGSPFLPLGTVEPVFVGSYPVMYVYIESKGNDFSHYLLRRSHFFLWWGGVLGKMFFFFAKQLSLSLVAVIQLQY